MRRSRRLLALIFVFTAVLSLLSGKLFLFGFSDVTPLRHQEPSSSIHHKLPRKIWQTSPHSAPDTDEIRKRLSRRQRRLEARARSWQDNNPGYEYQRLNDSQIVGFVREKLDHRPDIVERFIGLKHPILKADLFRYLALLAEGGVYTDIDTECSRPIGDWARELGDDASRVRMIIGIERDLKRDDPPPKGFPYNVQFSQWTFASEANHPVLQTIVEHVMQRLNEVEVETGGIDPKSVFDVYKWTGPEVFTQGFLTGLSAHLGQEFTTANFTRQKGPRLFGDVLVVDINGFATGVGGTLSYGNPSQLFVGSEYIRIGSKHRSVVMKDVFQEEDVVRLQSCWGGMVVFQASYFVASNALASVPDRAPLIFRGETQPFQDSSECCLIHADLRWQKQISSSGGNAQAGNYMNPYVRVTYKSYHLPFLLLGHRLERMWIPLKLTYNFIVPIYDSPRRQEVSGIRVRTRVWKAGNASSKGHYEDEFRVTDAGGYCSRPGVMILTPEAYGSKFGFAYAPPDNAS